MSLLVWLPLTQDLRNNGLSNVTITNNGATIDNNGKLGKCYKFGTGTSYLTLSNDTINTCTTECSLSLWINIISWNNSYATYFQAGLGGAAWNNYVFGLLRNASTSNLCFTISNGTTASSASYTTSNLELNTWYHIVCVYKTGHCLIYINGELYYDYTTTIIPAFSSITKTTVGVNNAGSYQTNCKLNDVRIYDHALSAKEVKEISKGLVCHYPLNDTYNSDNLLINGFGELGAENWANATQYSTTEVPSADTNIKASYWYNTNKTKIYRVPDHTLTLSMYLKSKGDTTGSDYPSLLPYDIDDKFISTFNCAEGFNSTYKTTLAQPLKKGDTVIYATDLSAWTTGDNHYYYVAIFGYKDSHGNIYPDMEYTQDSPPFGSKTDKSHINKTNNTITLNAPYAGADRPAGTTICQATAGSTYFYPFGGIALSTLSDWTYKTITINQNYSRMKYAKYFQYRTDVSNKMYSAGIKITDTTWTDTTIYDCSGYQNNATQWAYDNTGSISISSDTVRYLTSTFINSANPTSAQAAGTRYIYGNCELTKLEKLTVAFWCKPISGYAGVNNGQFSLTNYDIGANAAVDYQSGPLNHRDTGFDINGFNGTTYIHKRLTVQFTANQWHHYAITYD